MVVLHDAESVWGLISEWRDLKCASVTAARRPARDRMAQKSICSGKLAINIDFYSTQEPKGTTLAQRCVHAVPPSPFALWKLITQLAFPWWTSKKVHMFKWSSRISSYLQEDLVPSWMCRPYLKPRRCCPIALHDSSHNWVETFCFLGRLRFPTYKRDASARSTVQTVPSVTRVEMAKTVAACLSVMLQAAHCSSRNTRLCRTAKSVTIWHLSCAVLQAWQTSC